MLVFFRPLALFLGWKFWEPICQAESTGKEAKSGNSLSTQTPSPGSCRPGISSSLPQTWLMRDSSPWRTRLLSPQQLQGTSIPPVIGPLLSRVSQLNKTHYDICKMPCIINHTMVLPHNGDFHYLSLTTILRGRVTTACLQLEKSNLRETNSSWLTQPI